MDFEELEVERVYVHELKKRYEGCSEIEIKRLQLKIGHLKHIIERVESRNGIRTVEAAADSGFGSRAYELIER